MDATSRSGDSPDFATLTESIREQLDLIMADVEQVQRDCSLLADAISSPPTAADRRVLLELAGMLQDVDDEETGRPLCDLLLRMLPAFPSPWKLLALLFETACEAFAVEAVTAALDLVDGGGLPLRKPVLAGFAALAEQEDGPFADEELLARLGEVLDRRLPGVKGDSGGGLIRLLGGRSEPSVRRLAARLLDAGDASVAPETARGILGPDAYEVLRPYLEFTLATCDDLAVLAGGRRVARSVTERFRAAESGHGPALVRRAVAELGWERVRLGLEIEEFVELAAPGTLPVFVRPQEVPLFAGTPLTETGRCHLVTAHGGMAGGSGARRDGDDPVDRFRVLNIVHAELLGEILDVVPLDRPKVERIVAALDQIVDAFLFLFADSFAECSILPDVWSGLRGRVLSELEAQAQDGHPSAELTRLVLAFEDPSSIGEVRTMHGLKRFLHQKGLKLGFEVVDRDRAPNRTVDLLLLDAEGQRARSCSLHYAEFEAGCEKDADPWLPFPVRLAVDGMARQLVYGTASFPGMEIFLFGNEVHYYISFRNHPVFLRIDFSPPQRGGMIDLEYFGVSNYELDQHPNLELDGISRLFRTLDFDVQTEGTRLFVRYDKERGLDLGDLLEKAAALFGLVPYLMDVDWTIGSLQLPEEGRRMVAEAWAERYLRSGVLPIGRILNEGRSGIVLARSEGPTGTTESLWKGSKTYADLYSGELSEQVLPALQEPLGRLGLKSPAAAAANADGPPGLWDLERGVLEPLRCAVAAGGVRRTEDGLEPAPENLFEIRHESDVLADLLAAAGDRLREAVDMARPLSELDRFVEFETTGFVGGLTVERAAVDVRGGRLTVCAARDGHGVIRLGAFAHGENFFRSRTSARARWKQNALRDAGRFWALLLGANYVSAAGASCPAESQDSTAELLELAEQHRASCGVGTGAPRRLLTGMKAAPGRVVGRVVFGTEGRRPEDLDGAVLVAREVKPTDNQFLFRCAGVISTGGALLSHAALLAIQFGKPAILAAGRWVDEGFGQALQFRVPVYRESQRQRSDFAVGALEPVEERTERMAEGDLVILDAETGSAEVLGQGRDAAMLCENFRLLGEAGGRSTLAIPDTELMEIRAQQSRARHLIRKVLRRVSDPAVAAYASQELLTNPALAGVEASKRIRMLRLLRKNPAVAEASVERLVELADRLVEAWGAAARACRERIPESRFLYEIIGLRLRCRRRHAAVAGARELLTACGMTETEEGQPLLPADTSPVPDDEILPHLRGLAEWLLARTEQEGPLRRHLLRRIRRIGRVLGETPGAEIVAGRTRELEEQDAGSLAAAAQKGLLPSADCGLESHPATGWKAANLGEIDRLLGGGAVPPWFVITNHALTRMLAGPLDPARLPAECRGLPCGSLRDAIDAALARDADNGARAAAVASLWKAAEVPADLADEVRAACAALPPPAEGAGLFALRSSSCDEDTETEMRAGEFETYLCVRDADSVLERLKRTWSGFWTERALYSREAAGRLSDLPRGGVIVQRMVRSRVSGVLQTVNVGRDDLQEILVSVGLGLGEGIVSGIAAADLVTVVKDFRPGDNPVHFNYLTNDKPEQVVHDEMRGAGTRLEPTLYHQRLRPALEYTELCEITQQAVRLEEAYGYPLDIEFAIEGARLWLLQARPIATFSAELRDTLEHHPLRGGNDAAKTEGDLR